jgi:hypothetical protein
MKKLLAALISCFIITSCNTEQKLTFSYYEIVSDDCTGCAKVSLSLPKAEPESEIANQINAALDNKIIDLLNFPEKDNLENINEAIAMFEKSYFELQAEYSDSPDWEFTADGEITYQTEELICAEISSYIFTGGVHGYNANYFMLFDPKTGNSMEIDSIFSDFEAFKKLVEKKFRMQMGIPSTAEINSTGFMFEKNIFELPENIGFDDNEIILIYNQYEIASYASGQIIVEIPMKEAAPFMKLAPL